MGTPRQQVDGYLGDGWYDEWKQMDADEDNQEHRFFQNRVRLQLPFSSPLVDRIEDDFETLGKIRDDYAAGMGQIVVGHWPNKQKIGQVHDLYTLALIIVDTQNDILEAMVATGLAAAMVITPILLLQAKAQLMLDALPELEEELKRAESELSNAHNKQAIHLAVTFFEGMFPEISLTARAAIFLGDVIVDKALGPPNPTTANRYKGIATPGIKQFSEAVHGIPEYGHVAREAAEKMGKVATVATFYFDYEEIAEGTERVEKLRELTEKLKTSYDALVQVIEDNKPKIMQFLAAFDSWVNAIEATRKNNDEARKTLAEDMAEYQYPLTKPVPWPDAA